MAIYLRSQTAIHTILQLNSYPNIAQSLLLPVPCLIQPSISTGSIDE